SSPLYKRLTELELINDASFNYEYFEGEGFATVMFGGESKDPERVMVEINREVKDLRENGICEEDFLRAKKSIYGTNISGLNCASTIASAISSLNFKGRELFRYINCFSTITLADVQMRLLEIIEADKSVLSVILPLE
ncbi:MAG: insulinase family protein, partial [Oscillospiraceae bacterium]